MSLHSIIRRTFIISLFLFCTVLSAQESTEEIDSKTSSANNFFSSEERQKFFSIMIGYHKPITSGDNFMGAGLKGHSGFDFKVHMYIYKQFFIGLSTGSSYFDVTNKELLGNYRNTRISENYYYMGYEFLPAEKLRIGISTSIGSDVNFKNTGFSDSNIADQYDTAKLSRYGLYLNYEIGQSFMVYVDYSYNIANTDIKAPQSVSDFFNKGTYSSIGIGLVFTIGSRDLISRFMD